jgi:hypothetical protein
MSYEFSVTDMTERLTGSHHSHRHFEDNLPTQSKMSTYIGSAKYGGDCDPLCLSSSLSFFDYSFLVHHPLLAHAVSSVFYISHMGNECEIFLK